MEECCRNVDVEAWGYGALEERCRHVDVEAWSCGALCDRYSACWWMKILELWASAELRWRAGRKMLKLENLKHSEKLMKLDKLKKPGWLKNSRWLVKCLSHFREK